MDKRRVVITGIGVVSPIGSTLGKFWDSLQNGRSGLGLIEGFDATDYAAKIAAEVKDFDPSDFIPKKDQRRMDQFCRFALGAAKMAMVEAGFDRDIEDSTRMGAIVGSGIGGLGTLEVQHKILVERGPGRCSPFMIPQMISNMASGLIAIEHELRGPNYAVVSPFAEIIIWRTGSRGCLMLGSSATDSMAPLFAAIVQNISDAVVVTTADLDGAGPLIVYVNPAFSDLTGYSRDEVVGQSPRILEGAGTDPKAKAEIRRALKAGRPIRTEILNYTKRGVEHWLDLNIIPLANEKDEISHFASIERDITAQKNREKRLITLAGIDTLTGTYNRRHLEKAGERECARAARHRTKFSLILLDLDHFKQVNDQYGHEVGDKVLRHFAAICKAQLRTTDTLARVGGEEFAILVPDTDVIGARVIAERIRKGFEVLAIEQCSELIQTTVSGGLAGFLFESDDLSGMMCRADGALYKAKRTGRNRICETEASEATGRGTGAADFGRRNPAFGRR